VKETEAVFGPLRKRIGTAVEALESLLVGASGEGGSWVGRGMMLMLGRRRVRRGGGMGVERGRWRGRGRWWGG